MTNLPGFTFNYKPVGSGMPLTWLINHIYQTDVERLLPLRDINKRAIRNIGDSAVNTLNYLGMVVD
jgi:hypothetical protein